MPCVCEFQARFSKQLFDFVVQNYANKMGKGKILLLEFSARKQHKDVSRASDAGGI